MARALRSEPEDASAPADALERLPSPSLTVDLDVFEENLAAAAEMVRGTGKVLRPHVKTHRTPGLAVRQLGDGARGVTCATVGEAETMARAGIDDLLVANEIVCREKIDRITALAERASVSVAADSREAIEVVSASAGGAGRTLGVLVDVDVGLGRCGVKSPVEARHLASLIAESPGLRFAGIMGYEGRVRRSFEGRDAFIAGAFERLTRVRAELASIGLDAQVVSAGGTSTLREALAHPVVTEIQAGTYALMEDDLLGLDLPFRCAVAVVATVISRSRDQTVLDAGRKTIGCDTGMPVPADPSARTVAVSEEHVMVGWKQGVPSLGRRVQLRPSHVRTTFNLHDRAYLVRGGEVVDVVGVEARGLSQ